MAAQSTPTPRLSTSLVDSLILLTELIEKEPDVAKRKALREQRRAFSKAMRKMIDKNVDRATADYKKATKALAAANKAIKEAKKDLAKVAKTIEKLGRAADFIGKVAAAAA